SIRSGRRALALSQETKNVWVQITSTISLTYGLLDAGAYEEALALIQHTIALARTLPPTISFQGLLTVLGSVYHAVQQWQEAQGALAEADAMAEALGLGPLRVPALSQLCMNCALTGEWEQAYHFAVKATAVRKSSNMALMYLDPTFRSLKNAFSDINYCIYYMFFRSLKRRINTTIEWHFVKAHFIDRAGHVLHAQNH
ncbi:MAG: hypothetical protein ACJ8CB_32460, partial [Ktedonobacteraceae bacterium]